MYEDTGNKPGLRRIILMAVWLIVVVAVLWVAIWLIFFRHPAAKKVTAPLKQTTQQQKQATNSGNNSPTPTSTTTPTSTNPTAPTATTPSSNSATNTQGSSSAPTTGSSSATSTTQSSKLANTGAGNMILPALAATVAGGAIYQVRLRKKLVPKP